MRLNDEEKAMLAGEAGSPRRWAIAHQLAVGHFFDAEDLVPVSQAHIMGDTESLGEAGIAFLEGLAAAPRDQRRVRIPTITDPRGLDFSSYARLKQTDAMAALEKRTSDALEALGVLMTNTCINYQTVFPPVLGEHLAMGDTGVVIYSNSVMGARSNFEGGPSAVAAALTGRTPRYGYHLDSGRRGTKRIVVRDRPRDWSEWGALGGIVGSIAGSYWEVPVLEGIDGAPTSDELKHFGAALASFGSVALFHMEGVTPECRKAHEVFDGPPPVPAIVTRADLDAFRARYAAPGEKVDVVVFAAPQLSLFELEEIAALVGLSLTLNRVNRVDEAIAAIEHAIALHPDAGRYAHLGNLQARAGNWPAAVAAMKKAVALAPEQTKFGERLKQLETEMYARTERIARPQSNSGN